MLTLKIVNVEKKDWVSAVMAANQFLTDFPDRSNGVSNSVIYVNQPVRDYALIVYKTPTSIVVRGG